jgi:hypothetical protein
MPRAHFGLGEATSVERLVVRWPSGAVSELTGVEGNRVLTVDEPRVAESD